MKIPAAQFKAKCLRLMDEVEKTREPVVITKHGRAIAQLTPVPAGGHSLFGYMKDTVKVGGDVMAPIDIEWSAISAGEDALYGGATSRSPRRKK